MTDQKPPEKIEEDPPITDEEEPMPDFEESVRQPGGVGNLVRRAVMAGVGAVFLTEEGIRKTVSELKLPKEAFGYLAQQADKTRHEASRVVRKELRTFLNSGAFKQQLAQALSGLSLEIKAEVRLKPDDVKGAKPDLDAKVRLKSTPKDEPQVISRRALLWRLAPIVLALAGASLLSHLYGTHPVELIFALPSDADDGKSGLDLRLTRPDGKLVVRLEQNARPASGHTIVVETHLPRGRFKIEGWFGGKRVTGAINFDGEDSIEVTLTPI